MPPATAELITVGEQAIVRIRLGSGEVKQLVIGSANPLQIDFQGEVVNVLEISPIPPGVVKLKPYPGGAQFFARLSASPDESGRNARRGPALGNQYRLLPGIDELRAHRDRGRAFRPIPRGNRSLLGTGGYSGAVMNA